jgi:hypothetical protein
VDVHGLEPYPMKDQLLVAISTCMDGKKVIGPHWVVRV